MAQEVRVVVWQSEGSHWISPWLCQSVPEQDTQPPDELVGALHV